MKLKLKIVNTALSYTINLDDDKQTYSDLQKAVSKELEDRLSFSGVPVSYDLSLNGREILIADSHANLKEVGIVPGDILRIILTAETLKVLEPKVVCNGNASSKSFETKMPQNDMPMDSDKFVNIKTDKLPSSSCEYRISTDENVPADIEENLTPTEEKMINRYLNEPMLCRESTFEQIPSVLEQTYNSANVQTETDALVVVLHILMVEAGFILKNGTEERTFPSISSWKTHESIYNLKYDLTSFPEKSFQLTCFSIGKSLAVHGLILNSGGYSYTFSMSIVPKKYIVGNPSIKKEPLLIYANLAQLSQKFKDAISYPLVQAVQRDAGILITNELMSLPAEVKVYILAFLDVLNLTKIASVCKEMHLLSSEPYLWKKLFFRDFKYEAAREKNVTLSVDWKEKYKAAFIKQLERRVLLRRARLLLDNPTVAFPGAILPPPFGILGGDFDRLPMVPGMIPGLPPPLRIPLHRQVDPLAEELFPSRPQRQNTNLLNFGGISGFSSGRF